MTNVEIDLRTLIESKNPQFFQQFPDMFSAGILHILEKIVHVRELEDLFTVHANKKNWEFIDAIFEHLDFTYLLSDKDKCKIPAEGKLICVANHTLGALDGLTLLKTIGAIRKDVKIVASDLLFGLKNLSDLFLPYDIYSSKPQKTNILAIKESLLDEQAIIFFPAGEVSKLTLSGIKDAFWHNGPVYFARKYDVPILPIFVDAKNSLLYYLIALIHRDFSTFFLPQELFKKRSKTIRLKIGDPIPKDVFHSHIMDISTQTLLLRKHVYGIGKQKREIFRTEKTIIHPVDRRFIKRELLGSRLLLTVNERQCVFLVEYESAQHVIREIARLRELTFRKVGEGTGETYDSDLYDRYYKHLVLWDNELLEIVGAYRFGLCQEVLQNEGENALYSASYFDYSEDFAPYLQNGLELGRSFIQEAYWKSNALDYLWQGIGIFLQEYSDIRYLFGTVSISDRYSEEAKHLIVSYYKKWFRHPSRLAHAKDPYIITPKQKAEIAHILNGATAKEDYKTLKRVLKIHGFTVPILYKQYMDLCEPEGISFLDFGRDTAFSNCVDGLMLLQLDTLKPKKRARYLASDADYAPDSGIQLKEGEKAPQKAPSFSIHQKHI